MKTNPEFRESLPMVVIVICLALILIVISVLAGVGYIQSRIRPELEGGQYEKPQGFPPKEKYIT